MSSHRAIPACTVPRAPNTTGTTWVRHCHMLLTSTRRSPYLANFSACFLPTLPSAGQLMSMRRQVLAFLSLRQMSGRLALIFPAVGMVVSYACSLFIKQIHARLVSVMVSILVILQTTSKNLPFHLDLCHRLPLILPPKVWVPHGGDILVVTVYCLLAHTETQVVLFEHVVLCFKDAVACHSIQACRSI